MSPLAHEMRLLVRARLAAGALLLLALLAAAGVAAGIAEVRHQREVIERIGPQQQADVDAIAEWVDKIGDPGSAAYYTFHPTWDAPSPLAFAALGMRDVAPYILRVRALGLEAQLYDGENFNPELALPGRFDFAFVLVYLAPLFMIALFHDMKSSEREAGRLTMLRALPGAGGLWRRRIALRFALAYAALALPFAVGAMLSGVAALPLLGVLALIAVSSISFAAPPVIIGALAAKVASRHELFAGLAASLWGVSAFSWWPTIPTLPSESWLAPMTLIFLSGLMGAWVMIGFNSRAS